MCTSCLLISALMIFTPVENGGQSNYAQQISLAAETQVAINEMVKELPKSSETSLLRQGLLSLRSRLATVKNDEQAQNMINSELNALSQTLSNSLSSAQITELLEDMLIEDEDEVIKSLNKTPTIPKAQGKSWGWLR